MNGHAVGTASSEVSGYSNFAVCSIQFISGCCEKVLAIQDGFFVVAYFGVLTCVGECLGSLFLEQVID